MVKTHLTLTIDQEIYFKLKTTPDVNISSLINDFLKSYVGEDKESELKRTLRQLKKGKNKFEEKISIIEFQLNGNKKKLSDKDNEKEKEELEQAGQLVDGIKAAGLL